MSNECAVIWDDSLLSYDLGGNHPLHPVRLDLTMRLARSLGVLDGIELRSPEKASDGDLERVHTRDYIAAVRAAPHTDPAEVRHGLGSADNPVFDRMHESSALVAGGSIAAAERIVSGRAKRAVNLAGGLHHAMADHAAGFCVYNDCAVAISWMLANGVERIAYLDIDVHHGDGVQAAFYDDPRVTTISLHQHPVTLWPGTGFPTEVGAGPAEGSAVNVALPPGTDDAGWLRAFRAVVPSVLESCAPQVLVTQCGADTHREDPLAELSLSVDGQRAAYGMLRDLAERYAGGRWLVLGGGGYALYRVVPRSWTHLLALALDRDLAPSGNIPAEWTAHASEVAGNRALPSTLTDGVDPAFTPWDGVNEHRVDTAVRDTRHSVFPLHGLDPADGRD
ncbi:acetoin utilization protein AcuC [Actinopolyspora mortivallis]|uniref:Acetoin utilization protein AcuC n=1 Tax=Actinopolyspora mortivallis TaxID=33906 RepID=A0A2T0H0Z5_ACTMO|nr:acetoin utilization protein AcuC [Actinopolyspora mortivallis]PRW65044.1 acetoin utilization protein AcuC [Actinopolyspora mortivallis]